LLMYETRNKFLRGLMFSTLFWFHMIWLLIHWNLMDF